MSLRGSTAEKSTGLVGGRYEVLDQLGAGGVAVVHRARDRMTGADVALKRLRTQRGVNRERSVDLFGQEFHTLSQLAHPHVVSVYDYGLEDGAPYYTMELLDGGDLLDRVPCEWRRACALARDVCSALALLHSRRLVYRDLSPKNVRCTSDGRAKLLDFGALAPMGPVRIFVGTPAISAPEAVHLQPLDARADLYSLGATLYYALTGRRPYPANSLSQLHELWRKPPPPPSAIAQQVPPALDSLVMELLQLDAAHRPASAAETLDRLTGIAGLECDDAIGLASNAYLSTPTLVGRDTSLARVRRRMKAAFAGKGGALLVRGPRGVGRTRFLDACVLEAKIAGVVVLRADASDAATGDYGVARALAAQLVEALPQLARKHAGERVGLLESLVPSLAPAEAEPRPERPTASSGLQAALREWILAIAQERSLFIVVDDVDRVDLGSAALLALLARAARDRSLLVAASMPSEDGVTHSSALHLLETESRTVPLAPLSVARAERLLRSLFGDVPNVQLAAHRLHAVSGGLPRDLMQLAQHLVDKGLARYGGGSWSLPRELDAGDLPADMAEARRARIDSLGAVARSLGQALALAADGRYSFGECVALTEDGSAARTVSALDELVQAEMVARADNDYTLVPGFREPLVKALTPELSRTLLVNVSGVFARRPDEGFRAAQYLLQAGEEERGLDALLHFAESSTRPTAENMEAFTALVQSLPEGWLAVFDRGLELCRKYGRPKNDTLTIQQRVNGIASQLVIDATHHSAPLLEQVVHDAGLDVYASLDPAMPALERLQRSLAAAKERHATGADPATVLSPAVAIELMGRATACAVGSVAATLSVELLMGIPPLTPIIPLAARLASWQKLLDGVRARMLGQNELARQIYDRQLVRLAEPDTSGLDETYRWTQVFGIRLAIGLIEAGMGLEESLERADTLEASPLHAVNAIRIRMLYALWQGDVAEADRCNATAELLSIERARRQTNEGAHLLRELLGHALMDDLTRVKRTLDAIEPLAQSASGWRTVLHWANAEYQRIRGDAASALAHAETALASMHPAGHAIWSETAATRLKALIALDRCREATEAGLAYLDEAEQRSIGYEQNYIRMPLALAFARLGERAEAYAHADAAVASFEGLGAVGLNLGFAYETRARVALLLSEPEDFRKAAEVCAVHYRKRADGPLAARYDRLLRDGQAVDSTGAVTIAEPRTTVDSFTRIASRIRGAPDSAARARQALDLLLEDSGTREGFLLGVVRGEVVVTAQAGAHDVPESLVEAAKKYLKSQCRSDEYTLVTVEGDSEVESQWTVEGTHVYRPVLLSHQDQDALAITGVALLKTELGCVFRHPTTVATHLSRLAPPEELLARIDS